MDKTTNWLVRGASAIVIIFGLSYFAKPQINRLTNYLSELKQDKSLTEQEKLDKEYRLAEERCLNLKEISYSEFIKKLNNNEIKKWFHTPLGTQINTRKGKYLVAEKFLDSISADGSMDKLYEKKIFNPQDKNFATENELSPAKRMKLTCR